MADKIIQAIQTSATVSAPEPSAAIASPGVPSTVVATQTSSAVVNGLGGMVGGALPSGLTQYVVAPSGAAYTSIQAAVTAVEASGNPGAVLVMPGTYTENVTITKKHVYVIAHSSVPYGTYASATLAGSLSVELTTPSGSDNRCGWESIDISPPSGAGVNFTGSNKQYLDMVNSRITGQGCLALHNTGSSSAAFIQYCTLLSTDSTPAVDATGTCQLQARLSSIYSFVSSAPVINISNSSRSYLYNSSVGRVVTSDTSTLYARDTTFFSSHATIPALDLQSSVKADISESVVQAVASPAINNVGPCTTGPITWVSSGSGFSNPSTALRYKQSLGAVSTGSAMSVSDAGELSADASAVLDASSTTKGFLPPRMTGAQAAAIASPADGLMVYVTAIGAAPFTAVGLYVRISGAWVRMATA